MIAIKPMQILIKTVLYLGKKLKHYSISRILPEVKRHIGTAKCVRKLKTIRLNNSCCICTPSMVFLFHIWYFCSISETVRSAVNTENLDNINVYGISAVTGSSPISCMTSGAVLRRLLYIVLHFVLYLH